MPRNNHHLLRRNPPAAPPAPDHPEPRNRSRLGHHHASSSSQSQFQTPPSRAIPQLHPSSGPIDTSEPVHPAAAAQAAIFSLFGRGVPGRQPVQMRAEEEEEEEEGVEEDEYEEEGESQFGDDHTNGYGTTIDLDEDGNEVEVEEISGDEMVEDEMEDAEEEVEDDDERMQDRERSPSPLPSNLREISSLASWTVSTHKPGCGVAALRNPSPTQYWQSDGPQPHTLTLHFFKLVAVVKIRVYLDCEMDESYTPTKMAFLAGMGGNDLVEFATWEGDSPCGWVDVPLEGVGGRSEGWVRKKCRRRVKGKGTGRDKANEGKVGRRRAAWPPEGVFSDSENPGGFDAVVYEDDEDETADEDDEDDPYAGSVLKAMVVQMRIIENHQNGKDTHVRGFQVFARDDDRRRLGNAPSASADGRVRRHSARKSLRGGVHEDGTEGRDGRDGDRGKMTALEEPDWMGEPVIR